jgi:hypothetical protein
MAQMGLVCRPSPPELHRLTPAGPGPLHTGWWSLRPWPAHRQSGSRLGDPVWVGIIWRYEVAAGPVGYGRAECPG